MPIYEYICEDCNERFEKIVINKQQEISCPKCSSKKAASSFPFSLRPARAIPPRPRAASPAEAAAVAVAAAPATNVECGASAPLFSPST